MASREDNGLSEDKAITEERVAFVDKRWRTPTERANNVWNEVFSLGFPPHDLFFFAVEIIAQLSFLYDHEELVNLGKALKAFTLRMHYSNPRVLYGSPDKENDKDAVQHEQTGGPSDAPLFGGVDWSAYDDMGSEGPSEDGSISSP